MSDNDDLTTDPGSGNVLLHGELLRNKSWREPMDAAIYRNICIKNVKNALDIEWAIASYFMYLLYHGKPLADTTWWPSKRTKVDTSPNCRTITVLRWGSSVSSLDDIV